MGLPGAGKTYLAQHIVDHLQAERKRVAWLNADDVRKKYNDWDFSTDGRIRQSHRMRDLADAATFLVAFLLTGDFAIAGTIGIAQAVTNTVLYYFHERIWNRVAWGAK